MTNFKARARKSKRTRELKVENYLKQVSETLCLDLINVTICSRYSQSLLANQRIKRYLAKYHPQLLIEMEELVAEIEGTSPLPKS